MKKLIIILIIIFLTGCSLKTTDCIHETNKEDNSLISSNGVTQTVNNVGIDPEEKTVKIDPLSSHDLVKLFNVNKDTLVDMLGDNYNVIRCGPDGSYIGYNYLEYKLNAVFILEDFVAYFECNSIDGITINMTFDDAMDILGKREINEIFIPAEYGFPEVHEYELDYIIDGYLLRFTSEDNDTISDITVYNDGYSN